MTHCRPQPVQRHCVVCRLGYVTPRSTAVALPAPPSPDEGCRPCRARRRPRRESRQTQFHAARFSGGISPAGLPGRTLAGLARPAAHRRRGAETGCGKRPRPDSGWSTVLVRAALSGRHLPANCSRTPSKGRRASFPATLPVRSRRHAFSPFETPPLRHRPRQVSRDAVIHRGTAALRHSAVSLPGAICLMRYSACDADERSGYAS